MKQFLFFLLLLPLFTAAQPCSIRLSGRVLDVSTQEPLAFSSVQIEGTSVGDKTDDEGLFQLENICEGDIHLLISTYNMD